MHSSLHCTKAPSSSLSAEWPSSIILQQAALIGMMLSCISINFSWKKHKCVVLQHYQLCLTVWITYWWVHCYQSLTAKGYELSGGTGNHLVPVNLEKIWIFVVFNYMDHLSTASFSYKLLNTFGTPKNTLICFKCAHPIVELFPSAFGSLRSVQCRYFS